MNPQISIIVPVYNVESFLPRCLDSLTGQTRHDVEVICVDDESTDNSLSVLQRYAARDERVRVVSQKNKRQGGARNTGFDLARGEWVAFIDSDDWVDADYIERLVNAAERTGADIACASMRKECGRRQKWRVHYTQEAIADNVQEKFALCNCPPDFYVTNKLYRRAKLVEAGLRFAEHVQYEDVEYLSHALVALGRVVCVPGTIYHYFASTNSTVRSRQTEAKQLQRYNAHKAFAAFADSHDIAIGNRFRDIAIRNYAIGGVSLLKIRDNGRRRAYRLFDIVPIWIKRNR